MSARCMDCGAVTDRKADGTLVIRHADDCPNRRLPSRAAGWGEA